MKRKTWPFQDDDRLIFLLFEDSKKLPKHFAYCLNDFVSYLVYPECFGAFVHLIELNYWYQFDYTFVKYRERQLFVLVLTNSLGFELIYYC